MKALFLIFHGLNSSNGISKKIVAQVKAMNKCGMDTKLCHYEVAPDGTRNWMIDDSLLLSLGSGAVAKIKKRCCLYAISRYVVENNISLVYIRSYHNANPFTIQLVKKMRSSGAKVLMEIPTYPYDQEYKKWNRKFSLLIDRLFRKSLARHLNAIVTFSNEEFIFGRRTIRISNGIDFDTLPLKHSAASDGREIHLIGVAEIHYWHGFDRLIAGMASYYKTKQVCKVFFHLIGPFSGKREESEILPLIKENSLEPYVFLYGAQWGQCLDELFDRAHLAIGSLGRHRSGIHTIRTLKNREYAARGIPFIYSEIDEDFESQPYVLKVPADDSPVDIQALLEFCKKQDCTPEEIRATVHKLSWEVQMQKMIREI